MPKTQRLPSKSGLAIGLLLVLSAIGTAISIEASSSFRGQGLPGRANGVAVAETGNKAFGRSLANLPPERFPLMLEGKLIFTHRFRPAGSGPPGLDGLGPLYAADSCASCHFRDGRGRRPDDPRSALPPLIFELEGSTSLGNQLQDHGVGIPPEGFVEVEYREISGQYPDGTAYLLRRPQYRLMTDASGAELISARVAPTLVGMGLLEAVTTSELEAWADPGDSDGDGISGRPGPVDSRGERRPGRFGWKAERATLEQQVVAALAGDMGIDAATESPELAPENLRRLLDYLRFLAPPARRQTHNPEVRRGEQLFAEIGCASCHRPRLSTGSASTIDGPPELANQQIHAYTDLLLHDMGPDLADGRQGPESREWRTPPLWGLGLLDVVNGKTYLLHDGRARTFEEAILWHGGEASASRLRFTHLEASDREALLTFLGSI